MISLRGFDIDSSIYCVSFIIGVEFNIDLNYLKENILIYVCTYNNTSKLAVFGAQKMAAS